MKTINKVLSSYWIAKAWVREMKLIYVKAYKQTKNEATAPDPESIAPEGWEIVSKLNQNFIYPKNFKLQAHEI